MTFGKIAYRSLAVAAALAAVCTLGCAGAARSPRSMPAVELPRSGVPTPLTRHHVVRAGETLWSIAQRYETTVEALARANGLVDPTRLDSGRRLVIRDEPGARPAPSNATLPGPGRDALMRWPVPGGRILSPFGVDRGTHRHRGIDIAGARGEPVLASGAGRVSYSGSTMRGYGKTVILDHGDGLSSLYAHNAQLLVRVGDRVRAGQPIARVGGTGNATADHCHFEIRERDRPVDPARYLGTSETAAR